MKTRASVLCCRAMDLTTRSLHVRQTHGLPWVFPGWVGNATSNNPYLHPEKTAAYVTTWVKGARDAHGIDIDYMGIWNERSSDATYVKMLRQSLDRAGFNQTQIVAADGGSSICNDLAADAEYRRAVAVVGLHYPSDFDDLSACRALNIPIWASEDSSSYDDNNGAACWGRLLVAHPVMEQISSSIIWSLVGSYFHGTNCTYFDSLIGSLTVCAG